MKKILLLSFCTLIIFGCQDQVENKNHTQGFEVQLSKVETSNSLGRTNAEVTNPTSGAVYKDGDQIVIKWDFCVCLPPDWTANTINIDLYKGTTLILRIASNVLFFSGSHTNNYTWTIPYLQGNYGTNMNIRISDTQSSYYGLSSNFAISFSGRGTTFSNPIDIGTLGHCKSYSDTKYNFNSDFLNNYGFSGDDVYYKLTLSSSETVHISNCNDIHGFSLYLFDQNHNLIETGTVGDCDNGSRIDRPLSAGTYFFISEGEADGSFTVPYPLYTTIWTNCN